MVALEADVDVDVDVDVDADVAFARGVACLAPLVSGLEDVAVVAVSSDVRSHELALALAAVPVAGGDTSVMIPSRFAIGYGSRYVARRHALSHAQPFT